MADPSLTAAFNYYLVAHDLWGTATNQISNGARRRLQYVPKGQSVYATAGKAGDWLGRSQQSLTRLIIVTHGSPGEFFLGERVTSDNVAPLGGWLSSFFEEDAAGITILGCNAAADSVQQVGQYERGQVNKDPHGSYRGYYLLANLASASRQVVEGALDGQFEGGLRLRSYCRRVWPNGQWQVFNAADSG